MIYLQHQEMSNQEVFRGIHQGKIAWAGNRKLKIYGRLDCRSGSRMHKRHRVFFDQAATAVQQGYRPCGHCMAEAYKKWKHETI